MITPWTVPSRYVGAIQLNLAAYVFIACRLLWHGWADGLAWGLVTLLLFLALIPLEWGRKAAEPFSRFTYRCVCVSTNAGSSVI